MTSKQIREFNPNISIQFAQAFLYIGVCLDENLTPKQLIRFTKNLIRCHKIGYWMVYLAEAVLFLEVVGIMVWWVFFPTLLAFSVVSITMLIIMFGILMQKVGTGRAEKAFLRRLHDLQEAYGRPLDFSTWGYVKNDIYRELVSRADNVSFFENCRGQTHSDTESARAIFKGLLKLCANFKDLPFDGQKEDKYYEEAEALHRK